MQGELYKLFIMIVIGIFLILILSGCGRLPCEMQVRTEYVNTPVPCNIQPPEKPLVTNDVVKNTVNMMTYTDELEMALFCCIKDPRCIAK